jgi:hypothetical protein
METNNKENDDGLIPPPVICRPITHFCEIMWGYKDKAVLSIHLNAERELINQLYAVNPIDLYFHITPPDDKGLVVVWRMKDWLSDESKRRLEKEQAERRIVEYDNKKETKSYICELIIKNMGELMRGPMAENLADTIIKDKNIGMITMFGGTMDKIKW